MRVSVLRSRETVASATPLYEVVCIVPRGFPGAGRWEVDGLRARYKSNFATSGQ